MREAREQRSLTQWIDILAASLMLFDSKRHVDRRRPNCRVQGATMQDFVWVRQALGATRSASRRSAADQRSECRSTHIAARSRNSSLST